MDNYEKKKLNELRENRDKYRERVSEYLQLEFNCHYFTWVPHFSMKTCPLHINIMGIVNTCFMNGIDINNAAGEIYAYAKSKNLIKDNDDNQSEE